MYIDNLPPSFAYNNHLVIFNYAVKDILLDIIESKKNEIIEFNGVDHLKFNTNSYIVGIDPETKNDIFNEEKIPNLNNYHMALGWALKNSGVFIILDGFNALELSESLAYYSGLSLDYIITTYKNNVRLLEDDTKDEAGKIVASLVTKLYKLAKSTNKFKTIGDVDLTINQNLKGYCDFYIYKDRFFISCYASETMYLVDFRDNGFVIYGHSNDYGKKIEKTKNPEFDSDMAEFEPFYLKYLNNNMIIMEVKNNIITVQDSLVQMLKTIVKCIEKEEKIK